MQSFYAPGKVILAGEYAVLHGFEALALPVNKGQWLDTWIYQTPHNGADFFRYSALDHLEKPWLTLELEINDIRNGEIKQNEHPPETHFLLQILQKVPADFWKQGYSLRFESRLEFDRLHGLGSSSTFLTLLCNYFGLDPHTIQREIFGGSGYDVAIAQVQKSLVFWLANQESNFRPWHLNSELTNGWNIVFLGEKVNSRESTIKIKSNMEMVAKDENYRQQISKILAVIRDAQDIPTLETGLEMYQLFLSQLLNLPSVYAHFNIKPVSRGLGKWLGAWGGDMLLANDALLNAYPEVFANFEKMKWNDCIKYN
jgi:mevalonate kinase